ncbi:MAG: hypothetical protein NTV40_10510 [Solirubrobacterales bacterium]|nr:hypothetical protein [Solirubrobacterales bacterium]
MSSKTKRLGVPAALTISMLALVASTTGLADAAKNAVLPTSPSTQPKPYGILRLDQSSRFPARAIPKVYAARRADTVGGLGAADLQDNCNAQSVDLGTWCLLASPYPVPNEDAGRNNYFYATQKCVELGGYLPTAGQLIGAAGRVKLASTINDARLTASIDQDPTDGLKDRREMSSTLVTIAAGSSAAGSIGVSEGSKGDPKQGEPDPVPLPANPSPETLQYVTVYDNHDRGGFAGSKAIGQPENFRCAFDKLQGPPGEIG